MLEILYTYIHMHKVSIISVYLLVDGRVTIVEVEVSVHRHQGDVMRL